MALGALFLLFLCAITGESFVDPDLYGLLALAREAATLGRIPLEDRFAYTPTVYPSMQHEWGSGVVLFLAVQGAGGAGVLAIKYVLAIGIAGLCAASARRGGASWSTIIALYLIGGLLVATGFSTLRAQVFTLFFTAVLVRLLESDRRGKRTWIAIWIPLHLAWVQLHAGFVVGLLFLVLHGVESWLRGRPVRHLVLAWVAMVGLVLVNPYGWRFFPALWHGITLDRSLVTEWDPIWRETPLIVLVFGFSVLCVVYAAARRGWRSLEGLPLYVASVLASCSHQRHLSICAVVWCSLAPAWLEGTPLADALARIWIRARRSQRIGWAILGVACAVAFVRQEPWRIRVPTRPEDHESLLYPAGAARYLEESSFHGNLMTPFTVGYFVSWKLHPRVKISFDGRYEVAYPPEAATENRDFYAAREGWRAILDRYPTDAVLVPVRSPVAEAMERVEEWSLRYEDDAYRLFVRPGLEMPEVDRRGQRIEAAFP